MKWYGFVLFIMLTAGAVVFAQEAQNTVSNSSSEVVSGTNKDEIVYVTDTGTKYHKAGCRYLAKSRNPIRLSQAKPTYTPCSVCYPVLKDPAATPANPGTGNTLTGDSTATGLPIYEGPRGGRYHYSKSGKKVYERMR